MQQEAFVRFSVVQCPSYKKGTHIYMQFPFTSWKETALKLQIKRSVFGDSDTLIARFPRPDSKKTMYKDRKMQGSKKTVFAKSWLLLK